MQMLWPKYAPRFHLSSDQIFSPIGHRGQKLLKVPFFVILPASSDG